MSNNVFPSLPGLAWPEERVAIYRTQIQESVSGREIAVRRWAYARYRFKLQFDVLRDRPSTNDLRQIAGLFGACGGRADTFLYKASSLDFNTANAQAFGAGDGVTQTFRLARSYNAQFVEPIAAAIAVNAITASGAAVTAWTADLNAGTVTFASAPMPGAVLAWSGQYYWRCRFDADELDMQQFMADLWSGKVEFTSVKV